MPIQVFESFDALPADLADRCSYPAQPDFFATLDWYRCLYGSALRGELTPRIYLVRDDAGTPLAALFCAVAEPGVLAGLSNFYSLSYGPVMLTDTADPREVIRALVDHIAAERPRWHRIDLRLLDATDLADSGLMAALRDAGFAAHDFFQYQNWYLPTAGSDFDSYYAGRSSRLRNTIKRKEKKLAKAHDYRIDIHTEDNDALAGAIDAYVGIYNSSWKQPEPYPEFTPALIRLCARLGLLRLGVLSIDGEPAAAQLWITTPHKALIYKLAYREEYAELSPGSVLSRELFRQALDQDRVAEIDYGVGSEGYKRDWMSGVRELRGVRAHNTRTLRGAAAAALDWVKGMARRLRGPRGGTD